MDVQPTVTDMQTMCEEFMHRARYAKTEMCKDEPMSDNPPILLIGFVSESGDDAHEDALEFQNEFSTSKPYRIALLPLTHRDDPFDAMNDVVKHLPHEPFSFIAFAAEAFARQADANSLPDHVRSDYSYEDMATEYKENPFTDIRETLIVTAVDWNCEHLYTMHAPYSYDDNGVPKFDDNTSAFVPLGGVEKLREMSEELEMGRVPSMLTAFVMFMHYATEATKFTDKLQNAPKRNNGDKE